MKVRKARLRSNRYVLVLDEHEADLAKRALLIAAEGIRSKEHEAPIPAVPTTPSELRLFDGSTRVFLYKARRELRSMHEALVDALALPSEDDSAPTVPELYRETLTEVGGW